jgi:predicted TPR repeat methyltransferase
VSRYAEAFARSMEEASAHVREGRLDDAAAALRRALKYQPNEWIALAHLGACERFAGRYEEAERALRRALLVRPEEPGTLNELSLVMAAAGRRGEAIEYLVRATRAAPEFLQGWTNLGKLLYVEWMENAQGTPESAALRARCIECFDRILALDPEQVEFRLLRDAVSGAAVDAPPQGYVAQFFDRFAAAFEEKVAGKLRYTAPEVAAGMLAPLPATPSWSVVDLGCGTGLSGRIVKPAAARLVGVDVSGGMLERAAQLGVYDELVQDELLRYLDAQPASGVDLVLALDVFIYVGALERVVPEIARVLRPGGRVLFSVETVEGSGFSLAPSGRFQHSPAYVEATACANGLQLTAMRDFDVREELGRGIAARMFLFEKA